MNTTESLLQMSNDALRGMIVDSRAQVDAGLMSHKDCHDYANKLSAIIMAREANMTEEEIKCHIQ